MVRTTSIVLALGAACGSGGSSTGTVPADVEDQAAAKTIGDRLVTKRIAENP